MFKKYFGIDFIDFLVQFAVTIPVSVITASMTEPQEEIGVSIAIAGSLLIFAWRRARALRERALAPPVTTGEVQAERFAYLEDRVAELEQVQGRVMELEERLDFTERLLAQQRDTAARIGPGQ